MTGPSGLRRFVPGAPVHVVSRSADHLDVFASDVGGRVVTAAWEPAFTDGWRGWLAVSDGYAAPGAPVTSVWMRTARKDQVVKFRTFLRTLVHELCHHLDYEHLDLAETFHTQGFYARESTLVRELLGEARPTS